jgi:hypothetical protein
MKKSYNIEIIRGLLFVFDIENADDKELAELFDLVLRSEFFEYQQKGRETIVSTISYFLNQNDNFDRVFERMTTYFDDKVVDQTRFMKVLLGCLQRYQMEGG